MFGHSAFSEAAFSDVADGNIVITVEGQLQAGSAQLSIDMMPLIEAWAALQAMPAIMAAYVVNPETEFDGALQAGNATMQGIVRRLISTEFDIECNSTIEIVSTTRFIDSVERGEAFFAYSTELTVRSL